MRIEKKKFYLLKKTPGISGFKEWNKLELRLASGHHAGNTNHRLDVIAEFIPAKLNEPANKTHKMIFKNDCWLQFENGKLPGGGTILSFHEAEEVLNCYPWNTLFIGAIEAAQVDMLKDNPCLRFL